MIRDEIIRKQQYLDFFGGIVTVSVGHSNPSLTTKIKEQIDKVQHTSTAFLTECRDKSDALHTLPDETLRCASR